MTPKQTERLRSKIAEIKKVLAGEKRKFGGYDDSRGLRYLPIKYFVQLGDYGGGLVYLKWFARNFPDDAGFPDFLFEWTLILYKVGQRRQAGQKAFETFCSNIYVFEKFFDRAIIPIDKWGGSTLENPLFLEYFPYNYQQPELEDFAEWLLSFLLAGEFIRAASRFVALSKVLNDEDNMEKRSYLVEQIALLERADLFNT